MAKIFTLFPKRNSLLLISAFLFSFWVNISLVQSQEILLRDETFTINKQEDLIYDGNALHTWTELDEYPNNWLTPVDYYNGKIYVKYQLLEQPKVDMDEDGIKEYTRKTKIQFAIWQSGPNGVETAGDHVNMNGPGSVGEASSSLSNHDVWWIRENVPLDFTNVHGMWKMGIVVWDGETSCMPSTWEEALGLGHANNCLNPAYDPYFDRGISYQDYFFPMKLHITIVAVPKDATFSGWNNYQNGSPAPFKIDYATEKTTETIPSTWENSLSPLGPWTLCNNTKVSLTPGVKKYFRKPVIDPSNIRTLTVPARPAAPSVGVDFINETSATAIPATMLYSNNLAMTDTASGTGNKIPCIPGSIRYFQNKATASAFISAIQTLNIAARPAAPAVGIDYLEEKTDIVIPTSMEYADDLNFSPAFSGSGLKIEMKPGSTKYFRNKATAGAFKSEVKVLSAPAQPDGPIFTPGFSAELTEEPVPSTVEYSYNADMSGAVPGNGSKIDIVPGSKIYFRTKASNSPGAFKSKIEALTLPLRPSAPVYTIDFANETTLTAVPADDEYATGEDTLNATTGNNSKIPVVPGSKTYFRKKATDTGFCSIYSTLTAPVRPVAPVFTIDYANATTVQIVPPTVLYDNNAGFTLPKQGTGVRINLDPPSSLYFKYKATTEAFASLPSAPLVIPARPAMPNYGIEYLMEKTGALIPATVEYATNENFLGSSFGTNSQLSLTPGQKIYFRVKSTPNTFASATYQLTVPPRPDAPTFAVNFTTEKTSTAVDNSYQYATSETFATAVTGSGVPIDLTPGVNIYLRKKATNFSFYGSYQLLKVPARPFISSTIADTTKEKLVSLNFTFPEAVTGFETGDVKLTNASLETQLAPYSLQIRPVNEGYVFVNIDANVVNEGNFKANQYKFYFSKSTGIRHLKLKGVSVFPNPTRGLVNIQASELTGSLNVEVKTIHGVVVLKQKLNDMAGTLDLGSLPKGIYLITLTNNGLSATEKLFLE